MEMRLSTFNMTSFWRPYWKFVLVSKDEFKKRISQRIIKLRKEKGWTPSQFARAANKERQVIDKWESGEINLTGYTLYEIAQALETTLPILTAIETGKKS
jgi:putative transcriptional regulator